MIDVQQGIPVLNRTDPEPPVGLQALPGVIILIIRGMATDRGSFLWPLYLESQWVDNSTFSAVKPANPCRDEHQEEEVGRSPTRGSQKAT